MMKKKRGTIIYLGNFEMPDKNAAAHRVLNNAKIFNKLGYKVVFIGTNKNVVQENRYFFEGFEIYDRIYAKSILDWFKHITSIKYLKNIMSQYTDIKIVICYNAPTIATIRLKRFLTKKEIKVVGDYTEWYGISKIQSFRDFLSKIDSEIRMRLVAKRLDGLIIISSYMKEYYKKKKTVLLVPPLIDASEIKWKRDGDKRIIGNESKDENLIKYIFAGKSGQKDRVDQIVKAFSNLEEKNYFLTILGLTKNDFIRIYGSKMNDDLDKIKKNILFLGWKPHKETIQYILNSDIYIFFRFNTKQNKAGFPTKFVEATTCKVPVITTNVGDINKYIKSGENGILINDFEYNEITKALKNCNESKIFSMKNKIEKNIFDYNNYMNLFDMWIEKMNVK